jgi:hypothetical protein
MSSAPSAGAAAVNGSLVLRHALRSVDTGTERMTDQDAYADLRFDVTQPKDGRHAFHFFGVLRSDLDGKQDQVPFSPLESIGDAYGRRTVGTVYEAYYALSRPFWLLTDLRIGRQAGKRDEPVAFDGLAVDLGSDTVNVTVYGGAAQHFYEVDSHWGNDTLGGAGVDVTPRPGLTLSADWLSVADDREWDPLGGTAKDRMSAFKLRQQLGLFAQYTLKYRLLNGDPRDLSVAAQAALPSWDAEATLRCFRQFREQDELSTDLSPYTDVIGRSAPFQNIDLALRKTIAERITFDAGYFRRILLHSSDAGPFNKEFRRAYLAGEIADLVVPGFSWSATGESWESGGARTHSYGTDLTYRIKRNGRTARVAVGTYYSLYKYVYYTDLGLRDKVRTYYVDAKYPIARSFSLNGRYEFERGIEEYQVLRLGMRYDF